MPRRCSVFGCRSNYDSETEKTTTFSLPTDENRRKLWLRRIPIDLSRLKHPIICIKHFEEECVIRVDKVMDKGVMKVFPRTIPKLAENAVPTIFPNTPSYCSKATPKVRRLADVESDHLQKALRDSIESNATYIKQDSLTCLNDISLCLEVKGCCSSNWSLMKEAEKLHLCHLGLVKGIPCVKSFISVNSDLTFSVSVNNGSNIFVSSTNHSLKTIKLLNSKNILQNVMSQVEKAEILPSVKDHLDCAVQCLQAIPNYEENEHFKFIVEQIKVSQVSKNNRQYGNNTMIAACCLYVHSTTAYNALRKCGLLFLPHPRTLQRLICHYGLDSSSLQSSPYLENRVKYLRKEELLVCLLMDEIYIQPKLPFKCGEMYGSSFFDAQKCAKTAQVFMISSILSKYVDVVSIIPVANMTSVELQGLINIVLSMVERVGFTVVCLIADNNSVNRKAYELFTPNKILQPSIPHPLDSTRKLFFMFDTVHMLKCVRNNWQMKNNVNRTLLFPNIKNHSQILSAQYRHLELVFEKEKNSLVKYGHTLSAKVLYPTSIQKQNVKLALKIFNDNNIVALKHATKELPDVSEQIDQTVTFLEIIIKWWKLVNCKSVYECQRFNDPYREAVRRNSDTQLQFLNDFCHWLKIWRVSVQSSAALSPQTFQSLIVTTESFLQIIPYLFETYSIDYILLGKFQSDNLESRFGCYRQLSGANYYISFVQVLENERKLRFKNDVLFAAQNVNVHLKSIIPAHHSVDCDINLNCFSGILDMNFTIEDIPCNTLPILTYIGGYAATKVLQKSECDTCTGWLQLSKEVEVDPSYDFVKDLDRGKLTLPSEQVVFTVGLVWHTVSLLVNDFIQQFMSCGKQLSVAQKLCMSKLREVGIIDSACKCLLNNTLLNKLENISLCANRILINNFEKMQNDKSDVSKIHLRKVKKLRADV